jgi:excisionase family DNA binding protein
VYSKQIQLQAREKVLPMPRLKDKWLDEVKVPVAAVPAVPMIREIIAPRYLNVQQAAAYAGVTVWTIRGLIASGELKAAKFGKRFTLDRNQIDELWRIKSEGRTKLNIAA